MPNLRIHPDFSLNMPKRKEIFIETRRSERITIIRWDTPKIAESYCSVCGHVVEWVTVNEASARTGIGVEQIRGGVEEGRFEIRISQADRLLVCADSLRR